jgi:ATP-binding cassette subfamily C protein LapB
VPTAPPVAINFPGRASESFTIAGLDAMARKPKMKATEAAEAEEIPTLSGDESGSRDDGAVPRGLGSTSEDPLLECLVFVTHFHGRPRTSEVLRAGLPDTGEPFTPDFTVRAAERAGFRARVVKRRLQRISPYVLPTVLILEDGRACVLTKFLNRGRVQVMFPEVGGAAQNIRLADLAEEYSGYCIYIRPEVVLETYSVSDDIPKGKYWFWGTIFSNWWTYVQVVIAAFLINCFAIVTPLFIMTVYDRVIPNAAFETLFVLAGGVMTVFIFDFVIKTLRGYFIDSAGKRADVMLATRIFDQVLDMKMESRPASAGAFANTLRDFETLRDFFTSASLATLVDIPFIGLFILVIFLISGPIAIALAIAVPVVLLFGVLIQIPLNFVVSKNLDESSVKHGVLVEAINGLEQIKGIGAEGRMRNLYEGAVGHTATSSQRARALSMSVVNFTQLIQQLTTVGVIFFGVHLVSSGEMSVGGLIAAVILGSRAIAPLGQVAQLLVRFNQSMSSLKNLDEIMKKPIERPRRKTFIHRPTLSGAITFKDVVFNYPDREGDALKSISFEIAAGEHVAFIGKVGSGKSTIAKLVLGLFAPSDGTILIDGTDIHQIDPSDLRRNIGYVPQDPFLFRGTIRDNIVAAAPHLDDPAVLTASAIAGLDDFVSRNEFGFDMPVGERGDGLSGGQRQLITIARALVRNPNILVLDEPTSAMDTASEKEFRTHLMENLGEKTLILMTHRTSMLALVDRLIVLDQGRVMADGDRDSVVKALSAGKVAAAKN